MSSGDPRVALLDEALRTLDTYRGRSAKTSSAIAAWRHGDATRIVAALPGVGLALVTRDTLERAEAVVEAARAALISELDADLALRTALDAYDAAED